MELDIKTPGVVAAEVCLAKTSYPGANPGGFEMSGKGHQSWVTWVLPSRPLHQPPCHHARFLVGKAEMAKKKIDNIGALPWKEYNLDALAEIDSPEKVLPKIP